MQLSLYAIRDNKCGVYQHFQVSRLTPDVIRGLQQAVNDPKNMLCQYAGDYDLYRIAEVQDESGRVEGITPEYIIAASSLKTIPTLEGAKE